MICANCGKECPDYARFCPRCGTSFKDQPARQQPAAKASPSPRPQAAPATGTSPAPVASPRPNQQATAAGGSPATSAPAPRPGSQAAATGGTAPAASSPRPVAQPMAAAGSPTTVVVNPPQPQPSRNGLGTAGFVLALVDLFLSWIPVLGWILGVLGALFSVIGLFRKPRGLAIAGTVISFIDVIALLALAGFLAALF